LYLSIEYADAVGNEAAARGWLARAERLIGQGPPTPAAGWLLLTKGARVPDPAKALGLAEQALAMARRFDNPDLELASLGQAALARIQVGTWMRAWRCSTRQWRPRLVASPMIFVRSATCTARPSTPPR